MNSKFTSIITFIIGLVLIIWPSLVKEYIVLIIGALILSVGIASLIYYLMEKKKGNIKKYNKAKDKRNGIIVQNYKLKIQENLENYFSEYI